MNASRWLPAVCALLLVTVVPAFAPDFSTADEQVSQLQVPLLGGCVPSEWKAPIRSDITGADQRLESVYQCGDTVMLQLDVAIYVTQRAGKEAITESNRVVETRFVSAPIPVTKDRENGLAVREYHLDQLTPPAILWSWYAVGDRAFAAASAAKVRELTNATMLNPEDAAIITLVAWGEEQQQVTEVLSKASGEVWGWYQLRDQDL